jgi:diguanylate cyclase (GGDEF)-like protein/PAS domain S-box-containing protein
LESGFAQVLLEHSPDALLLLDPDGSISFLNIAAEQLFGYPRTQLLGADSSVLLAEASREDFHAVLAAMGAAAAHGSRTFTGSGRRADGTELRVEIICSLVPDDSAGGSKRQPVALSVRGAGHRPGSPFMTVQPHDAVAAAGSAAVAGAAAHRRHTSAADSISAAAAIAEHDDQLKAGVLRDPLTALPNGTLFNERLAAALRRSDPVDILLLNLADVTNLDTTPGCSAPDELLVKVANRLRNCVRPHDTVARLGGNQFVVLLTECLNADGVAARIAGALQEPLHTGGTVLRPGVSMGLASRTGLNQDGAELLRQADAAMTAAQTKGAGAWLRFLPAMLSTAGHQPDGETGLRRAVELGQISVHYQPVMSPGRDSTPGAVVRFEALARWERHGRVIPPNQFLPAAEQSGLIREIGDEVLRRACAGIRSWLAGDAAYGVAVNVSVLQFQHRDFGTDVLSIVASAGVDPSQLTLELTESAFFDADSDVLRQLHQLREAGVRIAMDDFGTGYSSLGRFQELPLDEVKIDGSLVAMIRTGQEQLPFFATVITAAHNLGLAVTAEGIETQAQATYLTDRGCDSLQGYLFARPAPEGELAGTLESALNAIAKVKESR